MNKRVPAVTIGLLVIVSACFFWSCNKQVSSTDIPSDADVFKAVVEQELSDNCVVITTTLVIQEKGSKREDGSVPCRVQFTCVDQSGTKSKRQVVRVTRELTVAMVKSVDTAGKTVWTAKR